MKPQRSERKPEAQPKKRGEGRQRPDQARRRDQGETGERQYEPPYEEDMEREKE